MFPLLRFDFIKMRRSRFTFILLLLLLLVVGGYYFYIDKKEMPMEEVETLILSNLELNRVEYEAAQKEVDESDGFMGMELKHRFENSERQYRSYQLMHEGFTNEDWAVYWQGELMNIGNMEETKRKELLHVKNSYTWYTPFTVFSHMDQMRWMEERGIQPVFPTHWGSWLTLYDQEFSDPVLEKVVNKGSVKYSSSGFHFIYYVFQYGFGLMGLLFFLFLFADIVTKEGFGRNGPIYMLRTQPIRRTSFWLSKSIFVMVGSAATILFVALIGLGFGLAFNRIGDWDYPILIYGTDRTYSFLTIAEFLGKSSVMFLLVLALVFSLLFLFSLLTNRAILAIGLTSIVIFVGQMLTDQAMLLSFAHWIPFNYIEAYPIVNGAYAIEKNNALFTYNQGILSLAWSTSIILLITVALVKLKKGVRV
ncbi:hypothetical protein [Lysinibacillus sp. 54212]|uniref:hypothetical protein n=1 Tax=Lysinibacillus sp. 54212 TaxID=3119829 RepID=UPI002FCAF4D0